MRPGQRLALATALALLGCLGVSGLALFRGQKGREKADTPERVPTQAPTSEPAAQSLPIEEILAEDGDEEAGAIFYMSRVREAVREGNPTFARELLRQMQEAHPNSVLVYEAEALLKTVR